MVSFPPASYPSSGKHVLTVDSTGNVEIGAVSNAGGAYSDSDLGDLGADNQGTSFPIAMKDHGTGAGQNLTITAQKGGGNADGGIWYCLEVIREEQVELMEM